MASTTWQRYTKFRCDCSAVGISLDVSRMHVSEEDLRDLDDLMNRAFDEMGDLEEGGIANPDEQRMVGHYWLRAADMAPSDEIRRQIEACQKQVREFARDIHAATIKPKRTDRFENILLVGIGGSALGPQLVDDALRHTNDPMAAFFCDNTDPDGIDRVLAAIGDRLDRTLTIVISKSGGTKETRNGMLEVATAYEAAGLDFGKHAVAVTGEGSALDKHAGEQKWLATFPMWDWVGGRTSVTSAVGLLPAALQGFDVDAFLAGARTMDEITREPEILANPATLLAGMWYLAAERQGLRDMVVIPYKDRLSLFARYLQQLVMESLGKELDLDGNVVHEGIVVYGNKGSTDQHAYVQQLREGLSNFFVTLIGVLRDRDGASMEVEPGVTSGDYLQGFLLGTRDALSEKDRQSMTITLEEVSPETLGALIALYERAVGFYASLVHINAYHQPGVEAGKKAAGKVLALQTRVIEALRSTGEPMNVEAVAKAADESERIEWVHYVLEHLAADPARGIQRNGPRSPQAATYTWTK